MQNTCMWTFSDFIKLLYSFDVHIVFNIAVCEIAWAGINFQPSKTLKGCIILSCAIDEICTNCSDCKIISNPNTDYNQMSRESLDKQK